MTSFAKEPPISGQLPLELDEEVWLQLPYEEARKLCQVARATKEDSFAAVQSICDRPAAWIARAHRYLGTDPRDFWARSEIEATIPLPEGDPGLQAQMRYIELVVREGGVMADASYFLSKQEMFRRAVLHDNQELINKYRDSPALLVEAVEYLLFQGKANDRDLFNRIEQLNQVFRNPEVKAMRLGFFGLFSQEIIRDLGHPERALRYFFWQSLAGHGKRTEVIKAIVGTFQVLTIADLLAELLEVTIVKGRTERLRDFEYILGQILDVRNIDSRLGQSPTVEALEFYLKWLTDYYGEINQKTLRMALERALFEGRFDLADYLLSRLNPERIIADYDYVVRGPHGLQVLEWMGRHGIEVDINEFNLGTEEDYRFKAVYRYLSTKETEWQNLHQEEDEMIF